MPNSLYPAWMREKNEKSFQENLEEQGLKESRERKKLQEEWLKKHRRNRKAWCWKCRHQGLDSQKNDSCEGCRWIICPECSACEPFCFSKKKLPLKKTVRWSETEEE
ncbi:hypothetical protein KZO25_11780 [Halomonas sp. ANAO-440]|uniref:hypothetical protein n=1 Tax=Halomonas sp. ANAO-440 TaxID=2861360 RepID=UPI001CAA6B16|nr:hypothetical protein [Halomonas sp. ANAO-440]MBZ0330995.1 hypothetical protein [Halomonas sp. ANAO-440]